MKHEDLWVAYADPGPRGDHCFISTEDECREWVQDQAEADVIGDTYSLVKLPPPTYRAKITVLWHRGEPV